MTLLVCCQTLSILRAQLTPTDKYIPIISSNKFLVVCDGLRPQVFKYMQAVRYRG